MGCAQHFPTVEDGPEIKMDLRSSANRLAVVRTVQFKPTYTNTPLIYIFVHETGHKLSETSIQSVYSSGLSPGGVVGGVVESPFQ